MTIYQAMVAESASHLEQSFVTVEAKGFRAAHAEVRRELERTGRAEWVIRGVVEADEAGETDA